MTAGELFRKFADFLRDQEDGSATLWNLFWLLGFGALLGVGLDTTAAMNTKARLQTVSDAAAHAGVIDIFPIPSDAVDTALTYSTANNGEIAGVVTSGDVTVGYWDREARTFQVGNLPEYNAVRVFATRDTARDNALGTFFLRIIGMYDWDVKSAATALYYDDMSLTDRCRKNGLFAEGTVEQTSNNIITGDYCMHGEGGLKINNNNIITCGVELSLPDPSLWQSQSVPTPSGDSQECIEYDGTSPSNDEMVEQSVVYRSIRNNAEEEYKYVKKILDAFVAGHTVNDPFNAIPPYITQVAFPTDVKSFSNDAKTGKLVPGTLYVVDCTANGDKMNVEGIIQNIGIYTNCIVNVNKDKKVSNIKPQKTTGNYDKKNLCDPDNSTCEQVPWDAEINNQLSCADAIADAIANDIPVETYETMLDTAGTGTYRDGVTQDTTAEDCPIEPGANGLWDNVFIFTTAHEDGNLDHDAVTFPNNMQIGRMDGCTEGGAARIYAAGSITTPSGTMIHGSHFVLLGDAKLAAKASGVHGLTIEAAGSIQYSAQGRVGGCPADEDDGASDVVVTVRPVALVE